MPSLVLPTRSEIAKHSNKPAPTRVLGSKYARIAEAKGAEAKERAIMKEIGDLDKVHVMSGRVLVALYIGDQTFAGSTILRTDTDQKEDVWQSTCGLVVKKGALAFKDDPSTNTYFHGQDIDVGQWVCFNPGDGKRRQINGVDCRLIEDALIDCIVDDPAMITHFT